jgi:hypothetical protein
MFKNRQVHNMCILCYYVENFFDPEADFQVYRRNLPHRRQAGVTYFVTFHLADSLPAQKLAALEEQRKLDLRLKTSFQAQYRSSVRSESRTRYRNPENLYHLGLKGAAACHRGY